MSGCFTELLLSIKKDYKILIRTKPHSQQITCLGLSNSKFYNQLFTVVGRNIHPIMDLYKTFVFYWPEYTIQSFICQVLNPSGKFKNGGLS